MQSTVRICGVDYPSCERVQDGPYCGIKTPGKTFWLFPVCDDDGRAITTLPPFLPREISPVTNEVPDLTKEYPQTVKTVFEVRQNYYLKTATHKQYLAENPDISDPPTEEDFEKGRSLILSQSLAEFSVTARARSAVWLKYGTAEIASHHGYMGDIWDSEIEPDGTEVRVSRHLSVAQSLAIRLSPNGSLADEAAWATINRLKYVMVYHGVPKQQFIYLEEIKESEPLRPPTAIVRVEALIRAERREEHVSRIELDSPSMEKMQQVIERRETLERVTQENTKAQSAILRERAKHAVTRHQVSQALGVGERQVENILKREGWRTSEGRPRWPKIQDELDKLIGQQRDYAQKLAKERDRSNRYRAEKRKANRPSQDSQNNC